MENQVNLNYAVYQEKLKSLENKTRKLLKDSGNSDLESKLSAELDTASERKQFQLAFVGQYGSGKSTIISALTGNKNIKIDANVSTDEVSKYQWNGIVLMDTPGILAGKVERHDEATKEALKECDLIFYILTSQLFDDIVFNNFIDLAYNQHLADKMFIVINKMNMETGEYERLVDSYLNSLRKTFSERGYNVDEFPIAFIDANDYIDGIDENDNEFIQLSHFERFIDMLNTFVEKKGLIKKRFDTPVRILHSYLKDIKVSSVDKTLCDFYNQFEQKLTNSQREIKRGVENVLYLFDSSSMNEVIKLSNEIGDIGESEWKQKQNDLNNRLIQMISDVSNQIESTICESYKRLLEEVNQFGEKDALIKYSDNIDAKLNSPNISVEEKRSLNMQKESLGLLRKGANTVSNKVSEMAPGVNDLFGGISGASGSTLHEIVLKVGHFFGKSFKPWEAVRWASNIAKFAKFGIPVITAGIDIWMQYREDNKENERLQQIKDSKSKFITSYQSEINKVKSQFDKYMNTILENYSNKRDEINKSKDELIQASKRNEQLGYAINQLEGEYVDFIETVNGVDILHKE